MGSFESHFPGGGYFENKSIVRPRVAQPGLSPTRAKSRQNQKGQAGAGGRPQDHELKRDRNERQPGEHWLAANVEWPTDRTGPGLQRQSPDGPKHAATEACPTDTRCLVLRQRGPAFDRVRRIGVHDRVAGGVDGACRLDQGRFRFERRQ